MQLSRIIQLISRIIQLKGVRRATLARFGAVTLKAMI
jgi:hypothetical protein